MESAVGRYARDYLNPPLIRGWLDCQSELIFRVSFGTGILIVLGVC
jgi:hypothetical protein